MIKNKTKVWLFVNKVAVIETWVFKMSNECYGYPLYFKVKSNAGTLRDRGLKPVTVNKIRLYFVLE